MEAVWDSLKRWKQVTAKVCGENMASSPICFKQLACRLSAFAFQRVYLKAKGCSLSSCLLCRDILGYQCIDIESVFGINQSETPKNML